MKLATWLKLTLILGLPLSMVTAQEAAHQKSDSHKTEKLESQKYQADYSRRPITDDYRKQLLGMGSWLEVCGEAIYATRPFVTFRDNRDRGGVKVRYTRSKDNSVLFATALQWPGETLTLVEFGKGVRDHTEIDSIRMLGGD